MANKYNRGPDIVESGNWNVADSFSKLKIMKLLHEIDEYIKICNFGVTEMIEEFMIDENAKTMARIKALYRLQKTLEMLIRNTTFAVKKKHKDTMGNFKKAVMESDKAISSVSRYITIEGTGGSITKQQINERAYSLVLDFLVNISEKILDPLNESDLIFTSYEDFDPDQIKIDLKDQLINQG